MRNRYYDPGTGRFTQENPSGLGGGNPYASGSSGQGNYSMHVDGHGKIIAFFDDGDPNIYQHDHVTKSQLNACQAVGNTACGGTSIGRYREADKCEVAVILGDYVNALRNNPFKFAAAFRRHGDYPGSYDFKYTQTVYEVDGKLLRADEFGNYAAGYAGESAWGGLGHLAMRVGGIAVATYGREEPWHDLESAPMIEAGAARAWSDSPLAMRAGEMSVEKPPAQGPPLTSPAGCPGN